jgi:hypothetical protein
MDIGLSGRHISCGVLIARNGGFFGGISGGRAGSVNGVDVLGERFWVCEM